MAAPGGSGEVRVRLMFEYPPAALPENRHLWFMLDTERCRAVADVSAIIRERFFYSQRGALSLYLDGCLLPPGESVRLIRDNDAISVKWEGSPPHDSPRPVSKKRRRVEDESDDSRDQEKTRVGHREAAEEEYSKWLKKKRTVTPEEDEVSKWPKKNKKKEVTLDEEEIPSHRPKKKKEVTLEEEVPSHRAKKKKEVSPEKEKASERPKKKKEVTPEEEKASERPKKKKGVTPEEEIPSERPQKKKTQGEDITSDRSKKKKEIIEEDKASERPEPYTSNVQKRPPLSSTVQKRPPPSSTVQKRPPPSSTYRKEASSSSCDTEHRGGQGRTAEPEHPLRTQQRACSSSPEGCILTSPPPVCNGHVAGRGTEHRSPLISTGRGVGLGRGLDNLSPRGRGFRGRGKPQLQNHFFYNYSPEAIKEQQLNEDVSNVSVVIQNPPKVPIIDYSTLPLLAAPPQPGKVIAFKLLELTENYTPEISDYKEGRVLSYDPVSQHLEVEVLSQQKKKGPGKFDLVYEGEDGTDIVEYAVPQECKISQAWSSLIEPRLVTEHLAAVTPGP
ncbi:coilin [Dendropsophus ebraccatus]|uniref:coilin n=1 Tax=Dendropsophus ebraccatus TaxID=150705 RepID=UPI0038311A18